MWYVIINAVRTIVEFSGHVQQVRLYALTNHVRFILDCTVTNVILPGATEVITVRPPSRCSNEHRYYLVFTEADGSRTLSQHFTTKDSAIQHMLAVSPSLAQHVELVSGHRWMNSKELFQIQASNYAHLNK